MLVHCSAGMSRSASIVLVSEIWFDFLLYVVSYCVCGVFHFCIYISVDYSFFLLSSFFQFDLENEIGVHDTSWHQPPPRSGCLPCRHRKTTTTTETTTTTTRFHVAHRRASSRQGAAARRIAEQWVYGSARLARVRAEGGRADDRPRKIRTSRQVSMQCYSMLFKVIQAPLPPPSLVSTNKLNADYTKL